MADTLQQNISGTTLEGSSITSSPAKTEVDNIQSAINSQGLTAQQMGALAESQMQQRVQAESKANPNQLITGGQTGALQTGTGTTPVTYQAYTYNSPSTTPKTASEPTQTAPTATTPTVATPPDTAQKYVYDKAQGGYVPQTATAQADPGQALIEQQRQMLQQQFNDAQQRINDQFNQRAKSMEGQLQTAKGASSMMLARMGAFQTSGSGIAYMNSLDARHQGAMNELESQRQYAVSMARNQLAEKEMALAWKSLERADQLVAAKKQEEKDYLDTQMKTMQMMQMSMQLAEQQKESAVSFMEGAMAGGSTFDDVKDYVEAFYNVDSAVAQSMWNLAIGAKEATARESYEKQISLASSLINIADKMGTGVEIPLGDFVYTYQGFNADNTVGGTETDASGNVKYWTLDKRTGETQNYDLGIVKKQDGWSTVNLGDNGVWAINAITGESKPFYASTGQQTWDSGKYATGQTGPALPGSTAKGQCGAMNNYFYGKGVVGNSLESKLSPLREYAVTDPNQVRPGMSFVQNIGSYGHIGFIEDVGVDPTNGKQYFTAFESNYKEDGKISHGRKMYFDDPTLAMVSDYPAPKLPGVGSDAPNILRGSQSASESKVLSPSELKTLNDMGYKVQPGMTQADLAGLEKGFADSEALSGFAQEIPTFAEWKNTQEAKELINAEEMSRGLTLAQKARESLLQKSYNDMSVSQSVANQGKLSSQQVSRLQSIGLDEAQIYNAQGIYNGSIPPPTGHGANTAQNLKIKAGLSALGYDLTKAAQDWTAMQKRIQTMNSADTVKMERALMNLEGSTEQAERLYADWKNTKLPSGFSTHNWAALEAAKRGLAGQDAAIAANTLISHVEDMANELSVVYKGGGTPTDKGLESASKSLSADWSEAVFMRNVKLIRENMQIRRNSMAQSAYILGNVYSSEAPATSSGTTGFSVTAPDGKTYSFKDQAGLDNFKKATGL